MHRPAATDREWNDWRWQLAHQAGPAEIAARLALTEDERAGLAAAGFRVGATPYYLELADARHPGCPVRRQIVPVAAEARTAAGERRDPLAEDEHSPAPALVHRYPDRALLLATDRCAAYCRHCNRRRRVGADGPVAESDLEAALAYLAHTPAVRDVIVSGGDPLLLSTPRLDRLLGRLRAIPHVEVIRVGTRAPVTLPMRVDDELVAMLRRHHPLYVNTQFNHPKEITDEARAACARLVDAGVPVGNQAVLLRGVNSSLRAMRRLCRELVRMRVRPYYLFQGDVAAGTDHLRTPVAAAVAIAEGLRGWVSGLAVPTVVVDVPGGGGKVPLGTGGLVSVDGREARLRTYRGELVSYPQPAETDCTVPYDEVFFAGDEE